MSQNPVVLAILKDSSTGLTPKELVRRARQEGIERPLSVARELIEGGLARLDSGMNGRPDRIKATRKAWEV